MTLSEAQKAAKAQEITEDLVSKMLTAVLSAQESMRKIGIQKDPENLMNITALTTAATYIIEDKQSLVTAILRPIYFTAYKRSLQRCSAKNPDTGKARCSLCHALKPESELNGIDLSVTGAHRYSRARCRRIAECNSDHANSVMDKVATHLQEDGGSAA